MWKTAIGIVLICWGMGVGLACSAQAAAPNVLFILCDDLGYGDLECYGHPHIKTPHLNKLAEQGMRLTDCYSAAPVCSSSRVGFLTGQTPNRQGIYDWIPEGHPMQLRADVPTLAHQLKKAGYATAIVGKWHCNGEFNAPTQAQPDANGFDHWFATQNNAAPRHKNPVNFVRNGDSVGPLDGFSCQLVTDEAIRWLKQSRSTEAPFYLHVCFHEPHEPVESPADLVAEYRSVAENEDQAQYFANVANVDRAVGRLMQTLDELELAENTLVFFTSDNGPETLNRYKNATRSYGSPGAMRGMKLHIYEGGIRVAGILRWPAVIAPGQVSAVPFCSVDMFPTCSELAGVDLPENHSLDGCSAVDFLKGKAFQRTQPLFWSYYRAMTPPCVALREGDWKIVAHWDAPHLYQAKPPLNQGVNAATQEHIKTAKLVKFELYNLAQDPSETTDLASQQPEILEKLKQAVITRYEQVQAQSPVWDTSEYDASRKRK